MAVYCIDDGGDGSQTNATQTLLALDWSKADTSIANLLAYDAAALSTSGNTIFIGDDHVESATSYNLIGPTSGAPTVIVSCDRTQASPTYKAASAAQITASSTTITFDGSFALFGIYVSATTNILLTADSNEVGRADDCTFAVGQNGYVNPNYYDISNMEVVVGDTSSATNGVIDLSISAPGRMRNVTFSGTLTQRSDRIISNPCGECSAMDLSGFTNASCSVFGGGIGIGRFFDIKTKSSPTIWDASYQTYPYTDFMAVNIGAADAPEMLGAVTYGGQTDSNTTTKITTGGGSVEGTSCSWRITTLAGCSAYEPHYTPWIYGTLSSAGTKTFSIKITSNTQYTDAQVWMEVEVMGTANEPKSTVYSDWRGGSGAAAGNILSSATNQDAGSTSDWTSAKTYAQVLSVASVVVGEEGVFRARVVCAAASINDDTDPLAYIYVDPKVTVS